MVVKVGEALPHTNADTLEIHQIEGYQVVSKKGTFNPGDLAVYIQPDSIVPQTEPFRWIWEPYLDINDQVSEKRRRITVKKLRGEYSEGLLIPLAEFKKDNLGSFDPNEGDDVAQILGISHYDPDAEGSSGATEDENAPKKKNKRRYPRTLRGWLLFILHFLGLSRWGNDSKYGQQTRFNVGKYDVDAFKNYPGTFQDGEEVIVTEKIHGSNGRFVNVEGVQYAGSRNLWKSPGSPCKFRQALIDVPEIADFCKANPEYILYGEITPTQKGFDYGCDPGEVRFFVFDVKTPTGQFMEHDHAAALIEAVGIVDVAPVLYRGPYSKEVIDGLISGPSMVRGAKHIREGIVIKAIPERRRRNRGRAQLKLVSNAFLEKDNK